MATRRSAAGSRAGGSSSPCRPAPTRCSAIRGLARPTATMASTPRARSARAGSGRPGPTGCLHGPHRGRRALLDPRALISRRRRRDPGRVRGPCRCRRRPEPLLPEPLLSSRTAVVVGRRRRGGLGRRGRPRLRRRACGCASAWGPRSDRPWPSAAGARPRPAVSGSDESPTLWLESELAAVVSPAASTRPATASTPIARVRRQPVMRAPAWRRQYTSRCTGRVERGSRGFMPHLPSRVRWGWCRRPAAA